MIQTRLGIVFRQVNVIPSFHTAREINLTEFI
jgi:hypothetical protein